MTTVEIRTATIEDVGVLASLHQACFRKCWGEAEFESFFERDGIVALLAVDAGVPIGFAFCWNVSGDVELLAIAVLPTHRGKGLGATLLEEAIARCKAQGATVVYLEVGVGNLHAQQLYQRHGFEITGCRKGYYHYPDGEIEDAYTMRADI